jgi:hypothetical protein
MIINEPIYSFRLLPSIEDEKKPNSHRGTMKNSKSYERKEVSFTQKR